MYSKLKSFPEYVKYFQKYFDDPDSIAKYRISSIRGGQCLISSTPAEQTHASNEIACPTKLTGLVTPEDQMLELTRRSDHWVRRDIEERSKLELEQHRVGQTMVQDSPEHKALMCLYRYPRERHFVADFNRISDYCAEPVTDGSGIVVANKVIHVATCRVSCMIPIDGRCPRIQCIAFDKQCVHELVIDQDFILNKWGTRHWNDETYDNKYKNGSHLSCTWEGNDPEADTCSRLSPVCLPIQSMPDEGKVRGRSARISKSQSTYKQLMNSFANLASVMSEHQEVAKIWLGIIAQTKSILREVPGSSLQSALLNVAHNAKTATTRVANSKSTASEEMSQFTPTQTEQVDMSAIPMTRSRKENQGHVTVNRLKPAIERGRKKRVKKIQPCSFCSREDHKIGTCKIRIDLGTVVTPNDIDQTILDFQNGTSPVFLPVQPILSGAQIYEQVPCDTNYVCVHKYATPEDLLPRWSSGGMREEALYLCVTFVFPHAVVTATNTKCFIRTMRLIQWITKSGKNRKRLIT